MISLQFSQKAFDFHFEKVEIIFDNIISNKIGKNKFTDTTIKFIKRYKNILISGKPNLLLEVHKKYLTNIDRNQRDVIKSFFKDNLYPNQFQTKYSKEFLDLIGIDTCFYCNRNYTINHTKKHARAELDHWFPKTQFPLLALSFYNLIPSCHSCNHIKGNPTIDWDNALNEYVHPYINEEFEGFNFDFFYKKKLDKLKVETRCFKKSIKTNKTLEFNKIKDIYDAHSEKELRDLVNLRYKYSNNYIKILTEDTFKNLKISKEEIYRMVFGIEIEENNYHKRPFSKFKKDIIEELLRIDSLDKKIK